MNKNVSVFLENPTNYTFKCGCGLGQVLDAKLEASGDMTIDYFYPCHARKLYGRLTGNYHKVKNEFIGVYNTENKFYYGPIHFSFNNKGEANGLWDNGVGDIRMALKKEP